MMIETDNEDADDNDDDNDDDDEEEEEEEGEGGVEPLGNDDGDDHVDGIIVNTNIVISATAQPVKTSPFQPPSLLILCQTKLIYSEKQKKALLLC